MVSTCASDGKQQHTTPSNNKNVFIRFKTNNRRRLFPAGDQLVKKKREKQIRRFQI